MANYTTNSGFTDLNGSMVVTNGQVTDYHSNNLGDGKNIQPTGANGLNFNVSFGTPPSRPYHITAQPNAAGDGYTGSANNNGPAAGQEPWSATASTGGTAETAAKKTAY